MTTVCYFSATGGELALLPEAAERASQRGYSLEITARCSAQLEGEDQIKDFVSQAVNADAIVLALHGGLDSCPAWNELAVALDQIPAARRPWMHIQPSGSDDSSMIEAQQRSTAAADGSWGRLIKLVDAGGVENLARAFEFISRHRSGEPVDHLNVEQIAGQGLYHPEYSHLEKIDELITSPDQLKVAIVFPQRYWVDHNLAHIDALIAAIEDRGGVAVGVFSHLFHDERRGFLGWGRAARKLLAPDGVPIVDVLISTQGFSMTTMEPSLLSLYPDLNIPVLQAMTSGSPLKEWLNGYQGMSPLDVSLQAAQPEFDGVLISRIIATRETDRIDPNTGGAIAALVPIAERVESMASLALAWAKLKHLPPSQRKVAIIFHHHPPRNDRIGCATGLDSFESIRLLLRCLGEDGYLVDEQYDQADDLAETMLAGLTCDRRWLPPDAMLERAEAVADEETVRKWFAELPAYNQTDQIKSWGEPPGDLFVSDHRMGFAGHLNGNIYLTIQPPRGALEKVTEEGLHDPVLPPPHHYLAHYRWIRDVFGAHAVIHVGTHGSLEWLPGKALGLSEECYPQIALAELPNIYPYIINNPGEGTQAKRRSAAALVDYLTPPLRNADLDDELAPIDQLCREYALAKASAADRGVGVAQTLWEAVEAADLHVDLELDKESCLSDPEPFVDKVRHYLLDLSDNAISDGLHVLGKIAADDPELPAENSVIGPRQRVVDLLVQLVRLPNGEVPSLREAILDLWGTNLDKARAAGAAILPGLNRAGVDVVRDAHQKSRELIDAVFDQATGSQSRDREAVKDLVTAAIGQPSPAIIEVLDYVIDDLTPRLMGVTGEIESIVNGLNGGFIPPGPSGAPTRGNADILPTGRNFFSLDPRTLPTRGAWQVGVQLADNLLKRYAEEHPDDPYPRNVGLILWGTANMRSRGEDVAEILHLWGLRPRWAGDGKVVGVDVVSLEELGRPRIDATPRISGFFRDAFPNLVELLDDCAKLVASLQEDDRNLLRAHVISDSLVMREQGLSEEDAWRLASLRVFGCPPGTYAAGVEELVESKQWQNRQDLAAAYIRNSSYAYGRGVYGRSSPELFTSQLSRMDATVKNEDTREYDMLSCTDFYNYYGGLIAAAEVVKGEKPMSFVGDSSDPREVFNRTTEEEARLVIRSRILNPIWIEGLKRHGYKGAGDLSKVLDILAGWEATADVVDDGMFERVAQKYALDPAMQQWFGEVNPYALTNILDKLLDMIQRGLWQADSQMTDALTQAYLAAEANVEDAVDTGEAQ